MKHLLCIVVFIVVHLSAYGKQPVPANEVRLEMHRGHRSGIRSLDISPDGKLLATCSWDHSIRLWDVASGKLIKFIPAYYTLCDKLRFNPDSRSIGVKQSRFSNGGERMLVLYNIYHDDPYYFIKKANITRSKIDPSSYFDFAFNPDGKTMAFSNLGKLNIWDLRQQKIKFELVENPLLRDSRLLTYNPNGKMLAISDGNNELNIKIFDTTTGQLKLTIKGKEQNWIKAITFNKNGDRIFVTRLNKIYIHNTMDGSLLKIIDNSMLDNLGYNDQIIIDDNKNIIRFSDYGLIQLQNIDDEEIKTIYLARFNKTTQTFNEFIRFDAYLEPMKKVHWLNNLLLKIKAESFLYFPSLDHEWEASRVKETIVTPGKDITEKTHPYGFEDARAKRLLDNYMDGIRYVNVIPDVEGNLLSASTNEGSIHLWDLKNKVFYKNIKSDSTAIKEIAFSEQGDRLLTAGIDMQVKQWNINSNIPMQPLMDLEVSTALQFNPKNRMIAEGTSKEEINLFEPDQSNHYRLVKKLNTNPNSTAESPFRRNTIVRALAFNPDYSYLASIGHREGVKIWNLKDGTLYRVFKQKKNEEYNVAAFSGDGRLLAVNSNHHLRIWNVQTGKLEKIYDSFRIYSLKFHPEKDVLIAGSYALVVFDLQKSTPVKMLTGHQGRILSMVFSADGKTLYTASEDKTVKIWDFERGKLIRTLRKSHAPVNNIALNKEETILAVASENIELWNLKKGRLITTLWSFDDNQWAVTQGNRFDVSENARYRINFFKGFNLLPIEPYYSKFHNPHLLSKLFKQGKFSF